MPVKEQDSGGGGATSPDSAADHAYNIMHTYYDCPRLWKLNQTIGPHFDIGRYLI